MAKRYAIWNKKDSICTPSGKVYTAEQWIRKFPMAGHANITVICGAGEINGSIFSTLGQKVAEYERYGCDFSKCKTAEEMLAVIEAFDNASEAAEIEAAEERKAQEELQIASLASIAASMEYQNLLTLEDVEV